MIISFPKQTVSVTVKYLCKKCGYRFTRTNSDWFTISPFNTEAPQQISVDIRERLSTKIRPCPKCGECVSPTTKQPQP